MNKKNVIVIGGGTGGHLFPAISLCRALQDQKNGIYPILITDQRCVKYLPPTLPFEAKIYEMQAYKGGFIRLISCLTNNIINLFKFLILYIRIKPKILVGFGGYPTFIPLLAGRILRIPIFLHEQNAFLGKVNHFFANYALKIASNFSKIQNLPQHLENKILLTGIPLRPEFYNYLQANNDTQKKDINLFRILVIGGSQGAEVFSTLIPEAIKIVITKIQGLKIEITQQVVEKDIDKVENSYREIQIKNTLAPFFTNLPKEYSECDLIICRAGASTIAEITHMGIPSILIPLPNSANDHQKFNAEYLVQRKAAYSFDQIASNSENLSEKICNLISNPELLANIKNNLKNLKLSVNNSLIDTIAEIISLKHN